MALTFQFDAALRQILEPGFLQYFPAPMVGQEAVPADANSARQAWSDPEFGTIMCKPLQLQPDFLDHPQQLSSGAVLRLNTDFMASPVDLTSNLIWEAFMGTVSNPWIFFTPASSYLAAPTLSPAGVTSPYSLTGIAPLTETGMGGVFSPSPGAPEGPPFPGLPLQDLRLLVDSKTRFPSNQGFYFRWFFPDFRIGQHQTVFAFSFGQYLVLCRNPLVEVYRDVSPGGDRTSWVLAGKKQMFGYTSHTELKVNSDFQFGMQSAPAGVVGGSDHSLLVMPFRRNRVLLMSNTGQRMILTTYNQPQMLPDNSDWDITRSDAVQVWALTPVAGRFQVQKLLYEPGPITLNFPSIVTDYTPAGSPFIVMQADIFHGESLTSSLQFPQLYTFPTDPASNDCPPPTSDGSAQTRTYGCTLTYSASIDQNYSPQYYGLQVQATPVYQDNPKTTLQISDTAGASNVLAAETSLGLNPGEGHMTAECMDYGPSYPLAPYYFRSEMPVQLALNGASIFTGYSDRIEAKPLRHTNAPKKITVRATDRWLLLEQSFLRSQRDYTGQGHITTVDFIARQCGIDTAANPAEYPAGWNGDNASQWDTPLGTPIFDANNLTGQQQLGWQPQPTDTGASFLKRIADNYSGWIMGFRSNGTFFYLPYSYYTAVEVVFHAFHGGVSSGLVPTAGAGLAVNVTAGSATVSGGGTTVNPGSQTISGLADNTVNYLYLDSTGTGASNTTGTLPAGSVSLGTAATAGGSVFSIDTTAASGRQTSTSPVFRSPVEHRTIEPSGNVIQVLTHMGVDYSAQASGLWIDWASVKNPNAPNYLGRYKWFKYEVAGAFSCAQLNALAYITFQQARRRRKRVTFAADYQPGLEIGHVFQLEGIGTYRLISLRTRYIRTGWDLAEYEGESTERGY